MVQPLFIRRGKPEHKFPQQLQGGPPSGAVPGSEYEWGTHASAIYNEEAIKGHIFPSVAAALAVATAVATFVVVQQQSYADLQPVVQKSVVSGQTPPVIPRLSASPQLIDLTLQAQFFTPLTTRQGAVPPLVAGNQEADSSQIAAKIWSAQPAAAIIANPIATFFATQPQIEDREIRRVWPSQAAGNVPPVISSIWAAPQVYDLTQQATLTWPSFAPVVISSSFRSLYGAPQDDPTQLAAQIFASVTTPPAAVQGPVPSFLSAGQPQESTNQLYAQLWSPLVLSSAPPSVIVETGSGGWPIYVPDWSGRRRTAEDIRRARIDFGVLAPDKPAIERPAIEPSAYFEQSTKIVQAIAKARAESVELRSRITDLETEILAEGVRRTLVERSRLERDLLLAQQRLTLLSVQEAVLIEEMEVLDVAFFALMGILMLQ